MDTMLLAVALLLFDGLGFGLLIDGLQFEGRQVPWGLHWIKLANYPRPDQPGLFPWPLLTRMTAVILYVLLAAVAGGAVVAVMTALLFFLFSLLIIFSALRFVAELFVSVGEPKRPWQPVPEKSKRKRKPKRKNEWLQRDAA